MVHNAILIMRDVLMTINNIMDLTNSQKICALFRFEELTAKVKPTVVLSA
jgi:hypothetical protein